MRYVGVFLTGALTVGALCLLIISLSRQEAMGSFIFLVMVVLGINITRLTIEEEI